MLEGGAEPLYHLRPILCVDNDRREKSPALIDFLKAPNDRLWWHTPQLFNPNNDGGVSESVFPGTLSLNILALSQELATTITDRKEILGPEDWPVEGLRLLDVWEFRFLKDRGNRYFRVDDIHAVNQFHRGTPADCGPEHHETSPRRLAIF